MTFKSLLFAFFVLILQNSIAQKESAFNFDAGLQFEVEMFHSKPYHATDESVFGSVLNPFYSVTNYGGYSINIALTPVVSYKNWTLQLNLGYKNAIQKQKMVVHSDISNIFDVRLQHKINAVFGDLLLGKKFNVNEKNAISFDLGVNYSIFTGTQNTYEQEFRATYNEKPLYEETDSVILGTHYSSYSSNPLFAPIIRLGYYTNMQHDKIAFHLTWRLFAFDYNVDHRLELAERTALAYSRFEAGSVGLSITYYLGVSSRKRKGK